MDIKLYLVSQEPIPFENIMIFQPTFQDILDFKTEQFNQLLIPYSLTHEILNTPEEEKSNIDLFEDIILKDRNIFLSLIYSLQYFCKTDNIDIVENGVKVNDFVLNKNNFEEFSEIILQICARKKFEVEKPPKFKAKEGTPEYEEALNRWKILQEGRRKSAERNSLQLYDVLNICEFYDYYISMDIIKKWSLFKIMQCYKVKMGVSNYRDSFSIYLVSGEKSLVENNHWSQQIRVG